MYVIHAHDLGERFLIGRRGAGYVLVDRVSTCRTIVEGEIVGAKNKSGTIVYLATSDGHCITRAELSTIGSLLM